MGCNPGYACAISSYHRRIHTWYASALILNSGITLSCALITKKGFKETWQCSREALSQPCKQYTYTHATVLLHFLGFSGKPSTNVLEHNCRKAREPCPPIVHWVALLGRRACGSLYQKCSVGLKYAKNALAASPRTPLGNSQRSHKLPSQLGKWTPPPNVSPPNPNLDSHAFGAQLLWSPNVKSWLCPCEGMTI